MWNSACIRLGDKRREEGEGGSGEALRVWYSMVIGLLNPDNSE